jgi:hypothetical protein
MSVKRTSTKKAQAPLIIEPHPKEYSGYPFITLIMYRKQHMLAIIDNMDGDEIHAYVLDACTAEGINEELLIMAAADWYNTHRTSYPVSIEFSRIGIAHQTSKIYRTLNMEYVSRVIGPVSKFPMAVVKSVKRRRRKSVPNGVEVVDNVLHLEAFFE